MESAQLMRYGVATLHEAAGRRGILNGIRLLKGDPFAGPAVTVGIPAGDNLGVHAAIEAAPAGSVVCVASGGRGVYGVLGDLLLEAARARGLAGLVIDDGIRDLDDLHPPPAVAARGHVPRGTIKARLLTPVGSPVALANVLVRTGDWIVCDRDGTCVLRADRLEALATAAEARIVREAGYRERLVAGEPTRVVFGLGFEPPPTADPSR
jgi:4-hydroxy-4-methyl-2-oxoglutarate aldolase